MRTSFTLNLHWLSSNLSILVLASHEAVDTLPRALLLIEDNVSNLRLSRQWLSICCPVLHEYCCVYLIAVGYSYNTSNFHKTIDFSARNHCLRKKIYEAVPLAENDIRTLAPFPVLVAWDEEGVVLRTEIAEKCSSFHPYYWMGWTIRVDLLVHRQPAIGKYDASLRRSNLDREKYFLFTSSKAFDKDDRPPPE